jgi:hypothetical protein
VVRSVGQEVDFGLVEEGGFSSVALRQDDFVKESNFGVVGTDALTFVDKFIKCWVR